MHVDRQALLGVGLMVVAMQLVSVNDALAKLLSQSLPVLVVVFLRTAMQSVFLFLLNFARPGGRPPSLGSVIGRHHVLRGFLWWIATFLFFIAIKDHGVPGALGLFFIGPIFVAAVAPKLLKEKFNLRSLLAALVGFVGALLILRPQDGEFQLGMLPAMLAGICYGCYLMATRHAALSKQLAAGEIAFGAGFWASVFGLPASILVWEWPEGLWAAVITMGVFSAVGHILIALACQRVDASKLAPYNYTEMLGAIVASYVIFGTIPGLSAWLGITVIIIAGAWAVTAARQRPVDAIV